MARCLSVENDNIIVTIQCINILTVYLFFTVFVDMIANCHDAVVERKNSKVFPLPVRELTPEEKMECVLNDPKFGMLSMMNFMLHRGVGKECSHVFGRQFYLPILVFVAQWLMFASIVIHNVKQEIKCNNSSVEQKMLMISVSMVYFVHSFFVYDDIRDRSNQRRVASSGSITVVIDAFQEHSFNLFVHIANLWIVFVSDDLLDALFNSLALEFLMDLDNNYERVYFKYSLEEAVYIYDHVFVTPEESHDQVVEKCKSSCAYRTLRHLTFIPFKILGLGFSLLPIYCFGMLIFGVLCK